MTLTSRTAVITAGILVAVAVGCSEPTDPLPPRVITPPQPPPPPTLTFTAGADVVVAFPADAAFLHGRVYAHSSRIESHSWTKVAGPASFSIENPASLVTWVTNLENGVYEFELTVQAEGGLTGSDRAGILVYDERIPAANERILEGKQWQCDWDCFMDLGDVRQYAAGGAALRVFVQDGASVVEAVGRHQFEGGTLPQITWWLSGLRLFLYMFDLPAERPVDVKIVF
jgi:hypothetical protein